MATDPRHAFLTFGIDKASRIYSENRVCHIKWSFCVSAKYNQIRSQWYSANIITKPWVIKNINGKLSTGHYSYVAGSHCSVDKTVSVTFNCVLLAMYALLWSLLFSQSAIGFRFFFILFDFRIRSDMFRLWLGSTMALLQWHWLPHLCIICDFR